MAVNLDFLREVEGYRRVPYIPTGSDGKPIGKSGVTVGTGIDLGQMNMAEFDKLPIDAVARSALAPYVGKTGAEAQAALRLDPPRPIDDYILQGLDQYKIDEGVQALKNKYDNWDQIDDQGQTVLLSMYHNFGPASLDYNTTQAIADGDYATAFGNLTDINQWKNPELYQRRVKEANLLRQAPKRQAGATQIGPLPEQMERLLPEFLQHQQPQTVPFPAQLPQTQQKPNVLQRAAGAVLPDWLEQYLPAGLTGRKPMPATVTPYRASQPYSFEDMVDYPGLSNVPERASNELLQPIEVQAQRKVANPLLGMDPFGPDAVYTPAGRSVPIPTPEEAYERAFGQKTYSF